MERQAASARGAKARAKTARVSGRVARAVSRAVRVRFVAKRIPSVILTYYVMPDSYSSVKVSSNLCECDKRPKQGKFINLPERPKL